MIMVALCGLLVGATLGTRFRVQVLLPATVLGLVVVAATAPLAGLTLSSAIMAAFLSTASLQIGFLGGLLTRLCITLARVQSRRLPRSTVVRS